MSNQSKVASAAKLNEVIFKEKANVSPVHKFRSLFPGLGYAAAYKVWSAWMPMSMSVTSESLSEYQRRSYKEYTNMGDSHSRRTI